MSNGANALIQTLANAGITTCFTNPGTSEMHFVAALDTASAYELGYPYAFIAATQARW